MKTFSRLFGICAMAGLLSACSSEDTPVQSGNNSGLESNYLSVSIAAAPNLGTRAEGDDNDDPNYDYGSDAEYIVKAVRFYFFTESGDAAKVKKLRDVTGAGNDTFVNYVDVTTPTTSDGTAPNVGKVINANIVLDTPDGDVVEAAAPVNMVAIVNPVGLNLGTGELDLAALYAKVGDYSSTDTGADGNGFRMTSSIYADGTKAHIEQSVKDHIFPTADAAKNNPVTIYVERVVAKVGVGISVAKAGNGYYPTGKPGEENEKFGEDEIFINVLGWNVTATANTSYLLKHINPSWSATLFGDNEPWNYPSYFRSFWAINPDNLQYAWGPFNTANDNKRASMFTFGTDKNYTYLQENANPYSSEMTAANPTTPSKVIVAGQLVKVDGTPMEFAEWGFQRYTVDGLKTAMLNDVQLYKRTTETDGTHYTQITENDVDFKTAMSVGEASQTTAGRYYVFLQLKDKAEGETADVWCSSNQQNAPEVDANNVLKNLGHAKIWKDGYTYWYVDIRHLNQTAGGTGYVGVVRNHLYDVTITALSGLGTPVYNPDETIYPEKPESGDSFIAANIKALTWRVVKSNAELNW